MAFALPAFAEDICCSCYPPNDRTTTCLNTDPAKLKNIGDCSTLPLDINLPTGWSCARDPLTSAACKPVADASASGVCQNGPKSALSLVGTEKTTVQRPAAPVVPAIPFTLNVPIPGFTPPADMSEAFNAYVYGVYRYLISIAAIVTTVMFIYGAFRYLVGSGVGGVARGKEIMIDSVIGLLLVLSATMILRTVNPALTALNPLEPSFIQTKTFDYISDDAYVALTGESKISRKDMLAFAEQKARETNVPELPCIVRASMQFESGGRVDVVGHDESFQGTHYPVSSRIKFLQSGMTYKNVAFTALACPDASCQKDRQVNDDAFDPNAPPDYGLDWRFSHGFGAGQSTIFPNSAPCPGKTSAGRGFRVGAKCFTIPEIVSAEGSAAATVEHFRAAFREAGGDPAQTFVNYAGKNIKDGKNNPAIVDRMRVFQQCMSGA